MGRIDTITDDAGTPYTYADYTYIGSRVAKRTYPLGANDDVDYEIEYNDLGRAVRHVTTQDATAIVDFGYEFDDNGNITSQEFIHRASSPDNQYTYDDLDRLTEADYLVGVLTEDEKFSYDKLGNRESVNLRDGTDQDYAVNYSTNRYDNDAGEDIVCDYDDAGNTTVDPNGYQYTYDYENRIIEIKDKDSVSIVEYVYDAQGRRIQKEDKKSNVTTMYYYNNNWQVLTEFEDDGKDEVERNFIYGNYIDEVLVMITDDGQTEDTYYYTQDHLYSPVALLDEDGDVIERYEYDVYGKMTRLDPDFTEWSGTESGNPYYFTGRRVDVLDNGNLSLQYSRNRFYDYHTGRWLTQDSIGYIDGMNMYEYVKSNPIRYIDLTGNSAKDMNGLGVNSDINTDLYTIEDCYNMCKQRFPGLYLDFQGKMDLVQCRNECNRAPSKCKDWIDEELKDGLDWCNNIPHCPSKICMTNGKWNNPDPKIREKPKKAHQQYHPGAEMCMRTKAIKGTRSGQQCCYDDKGNLMTKGPAAGTPDKVGWNVSMLGHASADVNMFSYCMKYMGPGWLDEYHKVRPPCKGDECPIDKNCMYSHFKYTSFITNMHTGTPRPTGCSCYYSCFDGSMISQKGSLDSTSVGYGKPPKCVCPGTMTSSCK